MSKMLLIAISLVGVISFSGCGGSKNPEPAVAKSQVKESYVVGKTTKDEILLKHGQPNGITKSKDGETLIYAKVKRTGKAWIPFYRGNDRVRISNHKFTFKDNLLTDYSTTKSQY